MAGEQTTLATFSPRRWSSSIGHEDKCFVRPRHGVPRLLVIDGCNIGRSASGVTRDNVDCAGLVSVIRWLLSKEFDVTIFLPVVYNNVNNYNATNAELLKTLEQLGLVTFTPARTGRGLRKAFINYDDLYVAYYANKCGGCILSGDKFKDILNQPNYSEFHYVIQNRTMDVRFRPLSLDFVRYGDDLFYRHAPELFVYEDVVKRPRTIRDKLFAKPGDADYQIVKARREEMDERNRAQLLQNVDAILLRMAACAGRVVETVAQLPFVDGGYGHGHGLVDITDVFDEESCRRFFEKYPRIQKSAANLVSRLAKEALTHESQEDTSMSSKSRSKSRSTRTRGRRREGPSTVREEGQEAEERTQPVAAPMEGVLLDLSESSLRVDTETNPIDPNMPPLKPVKVQELLLDLDCQDPDSSPANDVDTNGVFEEKHKELFGLDASKWARPAFPRELSSRALLEWFTLNS